MHAISYHYRTKETAMAITLAELDARIQAARDQEYILAWLLSGQSILFSPDDIPARIEALGDTYQRIIMAFGELAESPTGDSSLVDRNSRL
jgi:hypothetical protein